MRRHERRHNSLTPARTRLTMPGVTLAALSVIVILYQMRLLLQG